MALPLRPVHAETAHAGSTDLEGSFRLVTIPVNLYPVTPVPPMLAVLSDREHTSLTDPAYAYEPKYDGMRAIVDVNGLRAPWLGFPALAPRLNLVRARDIAAERRARDVLRGIKVACLSGAECRGVKCDASRRAGHAWSTSEAFRRMMCRTIAGRALPWPAAPP